MTRKRVWFMHLTRQVTKYNNALDMSIKIPRRARSRDGSGVGYGIRRGGKKGAVAAKILDQRHTQPQHKVVTVELEIGAYSGAEDLATMVQRCIHAAIEVSPWARGRRRGGTCGVVRGRHWMVSACLGLGPLSLGLPGRTQG